MESDELELYSNSPGFLACPNRGLNGFPTNYFSLIKFFTLLKDNSFPEGRQKIKKGDRKDKTKKSAKLTQTRRRVWQKTKSQDFYSLSTPKLDLSNVTSFPERES